MYFIQGLYRMLQQNIMLRKSARSISFTDEQVLSSGMSLSLSLSLSLYIYIYIYIYIMYNLYLYIYEGIII